MALIPPPMTSFWNLKKIAICQLPYRIRGGTFAFIDSIFLYFVTALHFTAASGQNGRVLYDFLVIRPGLCPPRMHASISRSYVCLLYGGDTIMHISQASNVHILVEFTHFINIYSAERTSWWNRRRGRDVGHKKMNLLVARSLEFNIKGTMIIL